LDMSFLDVVKILEDSNINYESYVRITSDFWPRKLCSSQLRPVRRFGFRLSLGKTPVESDASVA